ncbi:MAG: VWA domain-containing protein [Planctomycetes bacterium]|nr:VWA domain-containing protein [Planctomycetota bacterium]
MKSRPFFLAVGAAVLGASAAACSQTGGTSTPPAPDDTTASIPAGRFVAERLERAMKIADAAIATESQGGWTYRRAGGGAGPSDRAGGGAGPREALAVRRELSGAMPAAGAVAPPEIGGGGGGGGGATAGAGIGYVGGRAGGAPAKAPGAPPAPSPSESRDDPRAASGEDGLVTDDHEESAPSDRKKSDVLERAKSKAGERPALDVSLGQPVAHALRAGSTDDNTDFAEFLKFLSGAEQKPGLKGQYQPIDVRGRRFVRVVDASGRPVPAAQVAVVDEARDRVVGRGTTYGDGRVPVYPNVGTSTASDPGAASAGWIVDVRSGGVTSRTRWDGVGDEFTVTLPRAAAAPDLVPIDVAFLIDTTGSMGDEIASIQACLLRVAAQIRDISRESNLRVATVLYRDVGDEYLTATYAFTNDVSDLDKALRSVSANGGGDGPESLNQGLAETVDGLIWRDGAAKVVFLVADAPPHMDYAGDTPYGETVRAAVGKGIRIHTVAASGIDDAGTLAFRQIAQYTRGKFVFLEYGSTAKSAASHGVTGAVKSDNLEDILFEQIRDEVARWGR